MRFRKKPIVIEAVQFDGKLTSVEGFLTAAVTRGLVGDGSIEIETLEGTMTARPGDWIIKGVKGAIGDYRG